mmetsp:Transcript_92228/g.296515  ORF Transcript_92228/g.296515 Transcript_92228/m.296515 type:complete len:283 (+) Transcript_92228:249-1097(+)
MIPIATMEGVPSLSATNVYVIRPPRRHVQTGQSRVQMLIEWACNQQHDPGPGFPQVWVDLQHRCVAQIEVLVVVRARAALEQRVGLVCRHEHATALPQLQALALNALLRQMHGVPQVVMQPAILLEALARNRLEGLDRLIEPASLQEDAVHTLEDHPMKMPVDLRRLCRQSSAGHHNGPPDQHHQRVRAVELVVVDLEDQRAGLCLDVEGRVDGRAGTEVVTSFNDDLALVMVALQPIRDHVGRVVPQEAVRHEDVEGIEWVRLCDHGIHGGLHVADSSRRC